jgi:hypothetical protein
MNESTLWEYSNPHSKLRVVAVPAAGPRGNMLRVEMDGPAPLLTEGPARQLHLAIRAWVRRQRELRGDTPRGRRKMLERQLQNAGMARPAAAAEARP